MRFSRPWLAALIGIVLFASSCATIDYSGDSTAQRINWREYNDC